MANVKSAIKRVALNNKNRVQNHSFKSDVRTQIRNVEKFVAANDVENATAALQKATKKIDKAIQKGVIHKNTGTRQKARLSKKVYHLHA